MTAEGREAADAANKSEALGVLRVLPYALLLTQTCDLQNENKMGVIPLVNVAPVYNAYDYVESGQLYLLKKRHPFAFMVKLSSPELQNEDGKSCWVADLRFDMPIDRAFLLDRDPIAGFASEKNYVEAGKEIAAYRGRAALDDRVIQHVLRPLGKFIKNDEALRRAILEVWIKCAPESLRANRVRVQLLVESEDRDIVGERIAEWYSADFMPSFIPKGMEITVLQPTVELLSDFGRGKMAGAQEVDFSDLSADDHR